MDKLQAISAMMHGKKMRHKYFSPDEWVTIVAGHFLYEDGVKCSPLGERDDDAQCAEMIVKFIESLKQ